MLVAVSGGQDSLCLLKLLIDTARTHGWHIQVGHLDHRWRSESVYDAQTVAGLCATWKLPFHLAIARVRLISEDAARQWRYGWLGELALSLGVSHVVTGHTASDRAETLLFNLLRGSGSDGLASLEWERPLLEDVQLVRPLLGFTRTQTAEFCKVWQLPICTDVSNLDTAYRRNRIRLELLPYLERHFNPQVEQTLARTAQVLSAEISYLEAESERLAAQVVRGKRLERHALAQAPLALQRRVVRTWLSGLLARHPGFEQVEQAVACLTAPNRTRTAPLAGGYLLEVRFEWLVLRSSAPSLTD